jgi:heptosyltransferase-1
MRVVIIKTSALGDVIQALHALEGFAEYLTNSKTQLEWVVEQAAAPLVSLHPLVQRVHVIDTKGWRKNLMKFSTYSQITQLVKDLRFQSYDVALDLQGNMKSSLVMASLSSQRKVGYDFSSAPESIASLFVRERLVADYQTGARGHYQQMLAHALQQKPDYQLMNFNWQWTQQDKLHDVSYGVLAMGSVWKNKQIGIDMAHCLLVNLLESRHETVFLSWGNREEEKNCKLVIGRLASIKHQKRVKLIPKASLVEYSAWIAQAHWLVGADSLPLHLAALFNVPSFGIFGPSNANFYGPRSSQDLHWQGRCPYGITFERRCPKLRSCSTGACLSHSPQELPLEALDYWLNHID